AAPPRRPGCDRSRARGAPSDRALPDGTAARGDGGLARGPRAALRAGDGAAGIAPRVQGIGAVRWTPPSVQVSVAPDSASEAASIAGPLSSGAGRPSRGAAKTAAPTGRRCSSRVALQATAPRAVTKKRLTSSRVVSPTAE